MDQICHAGFCDLVENGSIRVSDNADKVLRVVGETLFFVNEGEKLATAETCSRLASILIQMQQNISADKMNELFASLSLEGQNGIHAAMQ